MLSVVFFLFYKINRINSFSPVILQPPDKTISQLVQDMLPVSYYTSDAADEEDSVDLGGRRLIKKKKENGA